MKDEIKEILVYLNNFINDKVEITKYGCEISEKNARLLLNYITNLQEENDYLKDIVSNTELSDEIKKADKWSKRELYKINYQRLKANQRLQEENERLKEDIRKDEVYFKTFELAEECDQKQDIIDAYKSRIDKAIEYIHNHQLVFELSSKKQIQYWFDMFYEDLINILQGSDKDDK